MNSHEDPEIILYSCLLLQFAENLFLRFDREILDVLNFYYEIHSSR